jgi:HD superfamily phosphodiesterase
MDVVSWSAGEAQRRLGPLGPRWAHTQAVAERATTIAEIVAVEDRPTLVAAAYLHDIGYAPELANTGFHPLDGALWLRKQGRERLAVLVAHHSGARFEATARGFAEALEHFTEEHSPVADALTYCDLTTGPAGESITAAERLANIELRYGSASAVAQGMSAAADTLEAAMHRTQARLTRLSHVI